MKQDEEMHDEKRQAREWFVSVQESVCQRFEQLETDSVAGGEDASASFALRETRTRATDGSDRGGGVMAIMRDGNLFEKVGVSASTVYGVLDEDSLHRLAAGKSIEGIRNDPRFWASGVSLVAHMRNPRVPSVHFNTRMFWTPSRWWFGGGTDLNPCIEYDDDTHDFHAALQTCCDRTDGTYYQRFREWADRYFFVTHRQRARGVGGIFFDDLNTGDWRTDFQFVQDVGRAFLKAYLPLVLRRMDEEWTDADREKQLIHRGLYAEFNLVYDRGTRFGLESGHDPDAVLMSLPPLARWP